MFVQQFPPLPALQPFIAGIMVQEEWNSINYANRNPVKVLPTSMTIIGFQYGKPMRKIENQEAVSMGSSGITGIHSTVKEYVSTGAIGTIIIIFKPHGLSHFTPYPLFEFHNADVPLELVFHAPSVRELEEKLGNASSANERVSLVQQFLLASLRSDREERHWISEAIRLISTERGALSVERLAAQLYVSQRTLQRSFNVLVGASPKQFANIVRFQHAISLRHAGYSYLDIVQACGYTDHAHFAKAFKAFAGCGPESFFSCEAQTELNKAFGDPHDSPSEQQLYH